VRQPAEVPRELLVGRPSGTLPLQLGRRCARRGGIPREQLEPRLIKPHAVTAGLVHVLDLERNRREGLAG
jgi:hypothetical protein